MKKKRLLTLVGSICLTLALVVLLLPACAKEEAPVAPTPARPTPVAPAPVTPAPVTPAHELPEVIGLTSAPVGATAYACITAIAPVMEEYFGVKVRPVGDASIMGRRIRKLEGSAQVCYESCRDAFYPTEGTDEFATEGWGPQPTAVVWAGATTYWGFAVMGNSSIKRLTPEEIRGKRFPIMPPSAAYCAGPYSLVKNYLGLSDEDVTYVAFAAYPDCVKALVEGKVDITYCYSTSAVTYEIAGNPHGIRFLPMDDKEAMARFLVDMPPKGGGICHCGVESARGITMSTSTFDWYCYPDIDEELVYRLAKFFDEKYDSYKDLAITMDQWDLDSMVEWLQVEGFPVHKGTIRYLKEKGLWTPQLDKWNEEAIERQDMYAEAWKTATSEAKAKGIKVDYKNEEWVELWKSYRDKLPRVAAQRV